MAHPGDTEMHTVKCRVTWPGGRGGEDPEPLAERIVLGLEIFPMRVGLPSGELPQGWHTGPSSVWWTDRTRFGVGATFLGGQHGSGA